MSKLVDLTGRTFARLRVVGRSENDKYGQARWSCVCDCGSAVVVRGFDLRSANTTSCGCYCREATSRAKKKPDDQISYYAAHMRVKAAKGSASTHACIDCDGPAVDWSLRRGAAVTYAELIGVSLCRFSGNPDDYEPRCRKCHYAYDQALEMR